MGYGENQHLCGREGAGLRGGEGGHLCFGGMVFEFWFILRTTPFKKKAFGWVSGTVLVLSTQWRTKDLPCWSLDSRAGWLN